MSDNFKLTLIWLLGGTIAFGLASLHVEISILGDLIVPSGPDSFYHAKRILNLLETGTLVQFDPLFSAPDGEYVSWPWAYDTLMALTTFVANSMFPDASLMTTMVKLPPLITFFNAGLIVILGRVLRLPITYILVAVIVFAVSPLTQNLHMIGRLDHHMLEFSFVIGAIILGIKYFTDINSARCAIAYGVLLGVAPAFHNGLFILQLPFLITLLFIWVRKETISESVVHFSCSLIITTLLFLIPSEPFRSGLFSYYFHSWFHLYIAICTSAIACYFYRLRFCRKSFLALVLLGVCLSLPVLIDIGGGLKFITGDDDIYLVIEEFSRPISWEASSGLIPYMNTGEYSGLLVLLPFSIGLLLYWGLVKVSPCTTFFTVSSVFGSVLLLAQYRLNYFGSFALYFPVLILCNELSRHYQSRQKLILACMTTLFVICSIPVKDYLLERRPLSGNYDYEMTHTIYKDLERSCRLDPGVVLADYNDGHYISFHTPCAVIANNFLITPLDFDRVAFTKELFNGTVDELLDNGWINYVFVRREDNVFLYKSQENVRQGNSPLIAELLFSNELPDRFVQISSVEFEYPNGESQPLAKVFKIVRSP